jgi:regulator of replication initiation timing
MNKELKKAYSATLQEKEEQIIILKEQVADLKTLINFLESENKRLQELQRRTEPGLYNRL